MTNKKMYFEVLKGMENSVDPWIRATGEFNDIYVTSDAGRRKVRTEAGFLRDDTSTATIGTMVTISPMDEGTDMMVVKRHVGDRKVKGCGLGITHVHGSSY